MWVLREVCAEILVNTTLSAGRSGNTRNARPVALQSCIASATQIGRKESPAKHDPPPEITSSAACRRGERTAEAAEAPSTSSLRGRGRGRGRLPEGASAPPCRPSRRSQRLPWDRLPGRPTRPTAAEVGAWLPWRPTPPGHGRRRGSR